MNNLIKQTFYNISTEGINKYYINNKNTNYNLLKKVFLKQEKLCIKQRKKKKKERENLILSWFCMMSSQYQKDNYEDYDKQHHKSAVNNLSTK